MLSLTRNIHRFTNFIDMCIAVGVVQNYSPVTDTSKMNYVRIKDRKW